MRLDAKISCKGLSSYTIYFLIVGGHCYILHGGRKVFLSNPEDENFTARAGYEKISFDDINCIYYNLPILEENGNIYDPLAWWNLLAKNEKENIKSIYSYGFTESVDKLSDITIKYIYRELLLDQFKKDIIQIPEYEKYLNWWKLLPGKSRRKILYENFKTPKHDFDYTLDDVAFLYNLSFPELDNRTMSILLWWFELDDNKKMELIHKYINLYFHITAPSIDEIKMLYDKL